MVNMMEREGDYTGACAVRMFPALALSLPPSLSLCRLYYFLTLSSSLSSLSACVYSLTISVSSLSSSLSPACCFLSLCFSLPLPPSLSVSLSLSLLLSLSSFLLTKQSCQLAVALG